MLLFHVGCLTEREVDAFVPVMDATFGTGREVDAFVPVMDVWWMSEAVPISQR